MIIENITQGSPEWLALRKTKITATDASIIMGVNPYKKFDKWLDQKTGQIPEDEVTSFMLRGTELEPEAREVYEKRVGYKMSPTIHVGIKLLEEKNPTLDGPWFDPYDWAMCSTDGLSADGKILLEIKCGKKAYEQASRGFIPDYYLCQMQHCLWLTGAEWCHYMAFNGEEHHLIKVNRNEVFIQEMIEKEFDVWEHHINQNCEIRTVCKK